MTNVQERLMQLLDELHEACELNNLDYVLAEQSAYNALQGELFPNNCYDLKVIMPLAHAMRLSKILSEKKGRFVESWVTNSSLPTLIFRYVDENTTLIDYEDQTAFGSQGVAVTILVAQSKGANVQARAAQAYLYKLNQPELHADTDKEQNTKALMDVVRFFKTKDNLAAFVQTTLKMYNEPEDIFLTSTLKKVELPDRFFIDKNLTEYDNHDFFVSMYTEEYLNNLYGEGEEIPQIKEVSGAFTIVDLEMPYAEFCKSSKPSIFRKLRKIWRRN